MKNILTQYLEIQEEKPISFCKTVVGRVYHIFKSIEILKLTKFNLRELFSTIGKHYTQKVLKGS